MDDLRVLFIDQDVYFQQSLNRVVISKKLRIDLRQSSSWKQAKKILESFSCDVIVVNDTLCDIQCEQLLVSIRDMYPMTLRILVSSDASEDKVPNLLIAAHQVLTKPTSPLSILEAIQTSSRLRSLLMNEQLRTVVHKMTYIPVVPKVYTELTDELRKDNSSNHVLAKIISQDISLTAGILKLVNTPFFGLSRRVDDMQQAVSILGVNLIRGLVLSTRVFTILDSKSYPGFDVEKLWGHCMDVARCIRAVKRFSNAGMRATENAFLAGLLHDIGKVVLAAGCPDVYIHVLQNSQTKNIPLAVAEERLLGVTHAEVGAYLLGLWGFSEPIVSAIAQHHGFMLGSSFTRLASVLHVVDVEIHNRYVRSNGYAPHLVDTRMLEIIGGDEVFNEWKSVIHAELDSIS